MQSAPVSSSAPHRRAGFLNAMTIGDAIAACTALCSLLIVIAGVGAFYQSLRTLQEQFVEFRAETRADLQRIRDQQITPEASRRIAVLERVDVDHDKRLGELYTGIESIRGTMSQILAELQRQRR